ncbi:DUF7144 family membrane protein [Nocardiopsis halophila]|uniref:DUF7144 family membrane protein n=1 Tax=Nocardiopsis halophila TaxID=141692 RepID=UPI00037EF7FB|nr:hypothetical protein [Nocardiopsis halophila]
MEASRTNGWMVFGAVLLLVIGAVNLVQGIVAMTRPAYYAVESGEMLVLDFSGWGLLLTVWGAVLVAAGLALFSGHMWARSLAVVLAAVNAVAQLGFLLAFPLWSLVAIAVDVLVIYGLTAGWPGRAEGRGGDPREDPAYRAGQSDAQAVPAAGAMEGQQSAPRPPQGKHAQPTE